MNKIIYLDAAASSLKPESVIATEVDFLQNKYANAGRGICARSVAVDRMVMDSRQKVADFINAHSDQIIFTNGTTDGMNRIARILDLSKAFTKESHVIVSDLDHHSARLPWEDLACLGKCKIGLCPLDENFNLCPTKIDLASIFVITAMSNVLGQAQNVQKLVAAAKAKNPDVITIVDAAQYVAYLPIDVQDWGCDFLCFSGHKIGADTGVGVMYIKEPSRWAVDKLGGGMVAHVDAVPPDHGCGARCSWTLAAGPAKFEAGTLPLTQIAGLPAAIDDLKKESDKHKIIQYLHSELSKIDRIKIITSADAFILTFVVDGMHCLDFGSLIGAYGVCLRVGNMCASWLHRALGYAGTIRISAGAWNTMDQAVAAVALVKKVVTEKGSDK